MNIPLQKNFRWLLLAALAVFVGSFTAAAATLTVSPAVTSNTYPGNITLTIGGLTNGEPVTVQKWVDANTNGVIDAGDLLLDTFSLNESGASFIGGITNISVPFDSNPVTNAITTVLNFAPPLTLENIVARQIYQVTSPTGRFPPVTAAFTVTNAATAQKLSGIIYSNGVSPVPFAMVVAIPDSGYAGATVADANGRYALNLNPGAYFLVAIAPNYYYDQSTAPSVTLTNGVMATNDLTLIPGTATISGKVFNFANSNGVGAVMLQLQSGNLFALAFTDTNGNYSAAVTPNFWKLKPTKERLVRRAFVAAQKSLQVNTSGGNATNANLALYPGNAMFYGRVTDNGGTPFTNLRMESGDGTNNLFSAASYTDANGYYAIMAYVAASTNWDCMANSSDNSVFTNYIVNSPNNTNLVPGQALLQNFVALPVSAHVSGSVHDNLGNPVVGVAMYASTFISSNSYTSQNVDTDGSGNYSLNVASGTWGVNFSLGGNSGLDTAGFVDYFQPHLVNFPPTNVVLNITVYQNGTPVMSAPSQPAPGQFGFSINGSVNTSYDVQTVTNLAATNWATLYTLTLTNTPFSVTDTHATNRQRYYRVKKN